eukprot:3056156-Rhodomonas_salina.2
MESNEASEERNVRRRLFSDQIQVGKVMQVTSVGIENAGVVITAEIETCLTNLHVLPGFRLKIDLEGGTLFADAVILLRGTEPTMKVADFRWDSTSTKNLWKDFRCVIKNVTGDENAPGSVKRAAAFLRAPHSNFAEPAHDFNHEVPQAAREVIEKQSQKICDLRKQLKTSKVLGPAKITIHTLRELYEIACN